MLLVIWNDYWQYYFNLNDSSYMLVPALVVHNEQYFFEERFLSKVLKIYRPDPYSLSPYKCSGKDYAMVRVIYLLEIEIFLNTPWILRNWPIWIKASKYGLKTYIHSSVWSKNEIGQYELF